VTATYEAKGSAEPKTHTRNHDFDGHDARVDIKVAFVVGREIPICRVEKETVALNGSRKQQQKRSRARKQDLVARWNETVANVLRDNNGVQQ
jgi:hypothetical protein